MTMDQDFAEKDTFPLISIAQWGVEEDDTIKTIMYGKFWFDSDFVVRNLDASVELCQYQSLSQRNFLVRMVPFLSS